MCAKELGSCNIASPHKAEYPNQSESSTKIQKTSKNVSAIVKFKEAQENRSKYQKVETANPVESTNQDQFLNAKYSNKRQLSVNNVNTATKKDAKKDKRLSVIKNTYKKMNKRQLSVNNVNAATQITSKKEKRQSVIKNILQKFKNRKKPTKNNMETIADITVNNILEKFMIASSKDLTVTKLFNIFRAFDGKENFNKLSRIIRGIENLINDECGNF